MLRPRPAHWIEALCPRTAGPQVVGVLARTGVVELELRSVHQGELRLAELQNGLAIYRSLLSQYGPYWRRTGLSHASRSDTPQRLLARALGQLEAWRHEAAPMITQLQLLEEERHQIDLYDRLLETLDNSALDLDLLTRAGPCLTQIVALLPKRAPPPPREPTFLLRMASLEQERFLLAVGPATVASKLTGYISAVGGHMLPIPEGLQGTPTTARDQLVVRSRELRRRIIDLERRLDALALSYRLSEALGDIGCLEWFTTEVGVLELASDRFALITGWTSTRDPGPLRNALKQQDAPVLLHFASPPVGIQSPQILDNPPWARPFEIFTRALGIPDADEADPSPLLVLIVPLLFGYMFGDLGQGLLLVIAGGLLRRRFSLAWLLMAGGASAALFGLVFGSLFGLEHLLPPLWLHPLERPLWVLLAPLGLGVSLLTLGQLLNALEAAWRGELMDWLWSDAGFLAAYLGIVLVPWQAELGWLAPTGALWYLLGAVRRSGLKGGLAAIGELLERGLQILVNTLSFTRVGAFALAHAGLSSAVLTLAESFDSPWGMALMLGAGNLLVILLEGLVVSIQTTRLVLFEFFVRFLRGNGRVFRPLSPPPALLEGDTA